MSNIGRTDSAGGMFPANFNAAAATNSAANSTVLSRNIGRAVSTAGQDNSAIKLFKYFITGVLNMMPLDDIACVSLTS